MSISVRPATLLRLVLASALCLFAAGCDAGGGEAPSDPPGNSGPPFGEGNGKLLVLSDLSAAGQIDVVLAGKPIGAVTRHVGCASDATTDDGFATAIRPAGTYELRAEGDGDLAWSFDQEILADEVSHVVLRGAPSLYEHGLRPELAGLPVFVSNDNGGTVELPLDRYHAEVEAGASVVRVVVEPPEAAQGDRIDILFNGTPLAENVGLGPSGLAYDLTLRPGANNVVARLSQDEGNDGTSAEVVLEWRNPSALTRTIRFGQLRDDRWNGKNVLYEC